MTVNYNTLRFVTPSLLDGGSLRAAITWGVGTRKLLLSSQLWNKFSVIQRDCHEATLVTTPTEVAARLSARSTIYSTFALSLLDPKRVRDNINWLIIDEVSMVPYLSQRNIQSPTT